MMFLKAPQWMSFYPITGLAVNNEGTEKQQVVAGLLDSKASFKGWKDYFIPLLHVIETMTTLKVNMCQD